MSETDLSSPGLSEWQAWLRWIITEPDGVSSALADPSSRFKAEPRPSCLAFIREDSRLTRQERLDVYAEAYYSRICKSLEEDFLAVRRWLGAEDWRSLVSDYLLEHLSTTPDLIEFGRGLPAYLKSWLDPGQAP